MFYTYTIVRKEKKGGKEKTGENVNLLPPPGTFQLNSPLCQKNTYLAFTNSSVDFLIVK